MTYRALSLPAHIGPLTRAVVSGTIDPRLADVHAMLRFPIPSVDVAAGGNFAIADVLFGVIEGVSAVLSPRYGSSQEAFLECMQMHYSVAGIEPTPALSAESVATELWFKFRNSMQHSLGLALQRPDNQGIRWPDRHGKRLLVFRDRAPLSELEIESLEQGGWPKCLTRPTLEQQQDELVLSVEALYVGTRRLITSVLADIKAMVGAEEALATFLSVNANLSSTPNALSRLQHDATLSAVTSGALTEVSFFTPPGVKDEKQ